MTLIFVRSGGLLSWLIRHLSGSPVSHAAIGLELHGVAIVLHAALGGVQITTRARFDQVEEVVAEFDVLVALDAGLQTAVEDIGESYDYLGLLGFAPLLLAARWFHRRLKNPFASPRATVCSDLVLSLDPGGALIPEWRGLEPEATTPGALLAACQRAAAHLGPPLPTSGALRLRR